VSEIGRLPEQSALAAWKLPPIVAAIAIAIVGGFYLGGPGLGMAVGALAAATILVLAARKPPLGPIVAPVANDLRRHVLVVLEAPLQSRAEIQAAVAATRTGAADVFAPDVLLVAPCASRLLDRWTSELVQAVEDTLRSFPATEVVLAGGEARERQADDRRIEELRSRLQVPLRIMETAGRAEGASREQAARRGLGQFASAI